MIERAYTVGEIDDLRAACRRHLDSLGRGPWQPNGDGGRIAFGAVSSASDGDRAKRLEEVVRTHMLAGHTAADVRAETKRIDDAANAAYEARQREKQP